MSLRPARSFLSLTTMAILSGCATGSSLSVSQAPLSFVLTDDGAYEIAAQQDGTAQALAERGDIDHGVPGYDALGGNALLPVSAVRPIATLIPASADGLLGSSLVSVAATPGQVAVNADAAGQVQVAVAASTATLGATAGNLVAPVGTALAPAGSAIASTVAPVAAPVTATAGSVASALAPAATAALPSVTANAGSALTAVTTTAGQPLTTVGAVLGTATPLTAAPPGAPNVPVLATIAAALGRRCC